MARSRLACIFSSYQKFLTLGVRNEGVKHAPETVGGSSPPDGTAEPDTPMPDRKSVPAFIDAVDHHPGGRAAVPGGEISYDDVGVGGLRPVGDTRWRHLVQFLQALIGIGCVMVVLAGVASVCQHGSALREAH